MMAGRVATSLLIFVTKKLIAAAWSVAISYCPSKETHRTLPKMARVEV
jgi:hypothetical protein